MLVIQFSYSDSGLQKLLLSYELVWTFCTFLYTFTDATGSHHKGMKELRVADPWGWARQCDPYMASHGGSTSYPCSFADCKEKELLPVICPHCEKHFYLRTYFTIPYISDTAEVSPNGQRDYSGKTMVKENAATAEKVALMKFKFHVSGDKGLPQKIYFLFTSNLKF
uniref:Uncharacterized protein n=1 Tax=Cyprinus carpio TaxID=7962 RepID=A0A8C1REJ3_CYPCA